MPRDIKEMNKKFKEKREYFHYQIQVTTSSIALEKYLLNMIKDYLREMNVSPGFYQLILQILRYNSIIWLHKFYDDKPDNDFSIYKFLRIVESYIILFTKEKRRARSLPQDWDTKGKQLKDATIDEINEFRDKLDSFKDDFDKLNVLRSKYVAHTDLKYMNNRKFREANQLELSKMEEMLNLVQNIFSYYCVMFDSQIYLFHYSNYNDIFTTLEILKLWEDNKKEFIEILQKNGLDEFQNKNNG